MSTNNQTSSLLGQPLSRKEGVLKVTGQARYAAEQMSELTPLIGWITSSDTAVGEITHLDTTKAGQAEGVHAVLTYKNAGPLKPFSKPADESRFTQSRAVLHEAHIRHYGAPVALVIADTLEQARYAASLVEYTIDGRQPDMLTTPEQAESVPESLDGGFEPDAESGSTAHGKQQISLFTRYTTPSQVSAAMEPHATVASFEDDSLTVYSSVQIVSSAVEALAITLEMDPAKIRVKSPYVGGGFGSKLGLHYDGILACLGARYLKKPVKVALSRRQVFFNAPHRGHSFQEMTLSCTESGVLGDVHHTSAMPRAKGYAFAEATGAGARVTYAAEHIKSTHRVKDVDLPLIDSTRSPGDAIGSLAFESAIDELAAKTGIDPVTFRLQNMPKTHPMRGTRFTSHHLTECLRQGAQKFGWQNKPAPAKGKVIGHGVASAMRMNLLMPSQASLTLQTNGRLKVTSDMTDIGTGSYTILAQIAADAFGITLDDVDVDLGDSRSPTSCGSGGSFGAASTGSAVRQACSSLKQTLLERLPGDTADAQLTLADGYLICHINGETTPYALDTIVTEAITESGAVSADDTSQDEQYSCGAQFAEVEVDLATGEVRLKRQYGLFSAGLILNMKTASSQIKGGMVWGAGYALTEGIHHHAATGSFINPDFGEYHIPVNRDIANVSLDFLQDPDFDASPVGAKGVGELGITGSGAAIANAIADATGVRVRNFPITMDKVLAGLSA